jgi:sigma-54-specific transcriptional regulator
MEQAITAGTFRLDLFYRLAVARVHLAPLRERPGDILPLARYFLGVYGPAAATEPHTVDDLFSPAATGALLTHSWPGNIRELENAIQHALLVRRTRELTPDDLGLTRFRPLSLPVTGTGVDTAVTAIAAPNPREMVRDGLRFLCHDAPNRLWDEIEELVIRSAFEHAGGNQLKTARTLGLGRSVVRARLIRFGLLPGPERATLRTTER